MLKTISATKARINFGDVMKQAQIAPVIVELGGKAYDQLVAAKSQTDWRKLLEESRKTVRAALKDRKLPDPAEMMRQAGRKEMSNSSALCIDASVVIQLVTSDATADLWESWMTDEVKVVAPSLLHVL